MNKPEKWAAVFEEESKHYANSLLSTDREEWLLPFCQYAVILTNVALSFIATSIIEGNEESTEINSVKFAKKMGKYKRKDVQSLTKFFLMDYIAWLTNDRQKIKPLLLNGVSPDHLIQSFFETLKFTKADIQQFGDVKENFETVKHSRMILSKLGAGEKAYIEFLVDTVEEVKNEFYGMMDKRFLEMANVRKP